MLMEWIAWASARSDLHEHKRVKQHVKIRTQQNKSHTRTQQNKSHTRTQPSTTKVSHYRDKLRPRIRRSPRLIQKRT